MELGFKVHAIMTDDHPPNVNAYSRLYNMFDGENMYLPS